MAIYTLDWKDPLPVPCSQGALTIGNFDGVHRGHQALLHGLSEESRRSLGPAIVLTFDPHPLDLLRPRSAPPLLTTISQRAELLLHHGAEVVFILQTSHELLNLHAREFFERVIRDKLQPRVVVPGFNFCFGKNREGTVESLGTYCTEEGIEFVLIAPLQEAGGVVSSTRIREALQMGRIRAANSLLNRPYCLRGEVIHGQHRGRLLGFPTANLANIETLVPADGVYAGRAHLGEESWSAAINIGPNPTFGEMARKLEVHLIKFNGDLYGQKLTLEFVDHLRDTRPFSGLEALKHQLERDVANARGLTEDVNY